MISLNTNLPAQNAANNFNNHYSKLATSAQRLSTGLRINSAADDASGLAVRELMRTDIAAIHQGVRNASDAISMIQVADGALSVIDEKLIRMKELAEQAATGTYDSTQRLLIDSEFQAMGEEIDRIARATDFNGIKLLDYKKAENSNAAGTGAIGEDPKIEPPEKWVKYEKVGKYDVYQSIEFTGGWGTSGGWGEESDGIHWNFGEIIDVSGDGFVYNEDSIDKLLGVTEIRIVPDPDGYTGQFIDENGFAEINSWFNGAYGFGAIHAEADLGNGNSFNMSWEDNAAQAWVACVGRISFTLTVIDPTADDNLDLPTADSDIPPGKVKIHFGPMNDAAEDYYYIDKHDATRAGLGLEGVKVQTQDEAQAALVTINDAIVSKDKIRAEYGTMQNRLENTITNLTIQAENLQAAESRISDADIATEMTEFVRNQVLAQSAIAMIAQANSMPQIAMRLIA